jgi:hypothetical protein
VKLWRIWASTSYAPYFLPLPVILEIVLRLSEPNQNFRHEWPWATAVAGEWLVFGGAIVVGVTAWEGWLTRRRLSVFAADQPRLHAGIFAVWAGAATWWLFLHTLILAFHLSLAAASGAVGRIPYLIVAVQYAAVLGLCALGALIGWFGKWVATAALASLALAAVPLSGPGIHRLMWFTSAGSLIGWEPVPTSYLLQVTVFVGCAVVVAGQLLRTAVGRGVAVAGLILSLTAAVPAADHDRPYWRPVRPNVTCDLQANGLTMCGIDGVHSLMPRIAGSLAPVIQRLRGLGVSPPITYVIATGETAAMPDVHDGIIAFSAVNGRSHIAPQDLVMAATVRVTCPDTGPVVERQMAVYGWALKEFGTDDPGRYNPDLVQQLRKLNPYSQLSWFTDAYNKAWNCDPQTPTYPDGVAP